MFAKVELWVVGLLCLTAFVAVMGVSALARAKASGDQRFGALGEFALNLSYVPEEVIRISRLLLKGDKVDSASKENRFGSRSGFEFSYPPGGEPDAGYLLLSRYDGDSDRSIVELVDLNRQRTIHRWSPDFAAINARSSLRSNLTDVARDNAPARARMIHPLLTPAGELIFQNASPLTKIGPCGNVLWTVDRLFHHSNEKHPDGGYLVPTLIEPQTVPGVTPLFKEDGIAHVSDEGSILYEKSVPRLLIENGLAHLIYGGDFYSDDPLHLNDVQGVAVDGPYFRRGDLFLSLRNVSAIVLYRPSTNKVLWLKQGPWLNQHDVDVLDDRRIAVFNNNRVNHWDGSRVDGANDVVIYDFSLNTTVSPYGAFLKELDVRTIGEGRSEILSDGDVVIEEADYGRVLRLRQNGEVEWSYVNRASDGRVYLLNWSRELSPEEGTHFVRQLESIGCEGR